MNRQEPCAASESHGNLVIWGEGGRRAAIAPYRAGAPWRVSQVKMYSSRGSSTVRTLQVPASSIAVHT